MKSIRWTKLRTIQKIAGGGGRFDTLRRAVHLLITSQILRRDQSRPVGIMGLSDLYLFVPLKNHPARVRFAADANVKQAVTWLKIFAVIFIIRQTASTSATVRLTLECQWWLRWGLVCSICYTCLTFTSESECVWPYKEHLTLKMVTTRYQQQIFQPASKAIILSRLIFKCKISRMDFIINDIFYI